MKHIFLVTMIVVLSHASVSAGCYQALTSRISGLGKAIENVNNVPIIGKLTNLLPMAALAASLKECPIQTMVVLMVLGGYFLSQNPMIQEAIDQYDLSDMQWMRNNKKEEKPLDESLFIFDAEDDELDDEMTDEFDLLDEDSEKKKYRKPQQAKKALL